MERINICTIPPEYRFEGEHTIRKISKKFNNKYGVIDSSVVLSAISIVLARFTLRKQLYIDFEDIKPKMKCCVYCELLELDFDTYTENLKNQMKQIDAMSKSSDIIILIQKNSNYINKLLNKYNIVFNVDIKENKIKIEVFYPDEKYGVKMMESLLNCIEYLLYREKIENVCKIPFNLMNDNNVYSNINHEYPQRLEEIFDSVAEKYSQYSAITYMNSTLTYEEVKRQSDFIANYIIQNFPKNSKKRIGILFERNINLISVILGVLKSGNAYVPIDPNLPKNRIEYIIKNSGVSALIDSKGINNINTHIDDVDIFSFEKIMSKYKMNDLKIAKPNQQNPNSLSYIIYTSGTTGKPKGVRIEHKSVINFITHMKNEISFQSGMNFTQTASISFDASVLEIWLSIAFNGNLHIIPKKMLVDFEELSEYFFNYKINASFLPVQIAENLVIQGDNIKYIMTGGSKTNNSIVKKFSDKGIQYINMYGPTESTIAISMWKADSTRYNNIPIGTPIQEAEIFIADEHNVKLPLGMIGELCVGGTPVSRGYVDEEFNLGKFWEENSVRFYKTGDKCRQLSDGNFEYFERIDKQVKIRGFRIEISEIEETIKKFELVRESIVIVKNIEKNAQIVAYVKFVNNKDYINLLENFLSDKLPDYEIPSKIIKIDEFPLTINGKIDVEKLSNIKFIIEDGKYPITPIQKRIYNVWKEILDEDILEINISFFEYGGNSINVIKMIKKIKENFAVNISIDQFMQDPTICGLETLIVHKININQLADKLVNIIPRKYNPKVLVEYNQVILEVDYGVNDIRNLLKKSIGINEFPNKIITNNSSHCYELDKVKLEVKKMLSGRKSYKNDITESVLNISTSQNKILKKSRNEFIVSRFYFRTLKKKEDILKAINQLIYLQPMLRSKIQRINWENQIIVNKKKDNHNFLDISFLNLEDKFNILEYSDSLFKSSEQNTGTFNFIIYKLDEKQYILMYSISHLFFDAASKNLLNVEFNRLLNEKNSKKNSIDRGYEKYIELQRKSADIRKIDSIDFSIIKTKSHKYNKFSDRVFEVCNAISEEAALKKSFEFYSKIFDSYKLNVRITKNARIINKEFIKTIGDFHVSMPVLISSNSIDSVVEKINKDFIKYYELYGVFFEDYIYGINSYSEKIKNMYENVDFGFNFLGNLEKYDFESEISDLRDNHTRAFSTAFQYDERLFLKIRCPNIFLSCLINELNLKEYK